VKKTEIKHEKIKLLKIIKIYQYFRCLLKNKKESTRLSGTISVVKLLK
jgi:hypothetical protein